MIKYIQNRASGIGHRASGIGHRASGIVNFDDLIFLVICRNQIVKTTNFHSSFNTLVFSVSWSTLKIVSLVICFCLWMFNTPIVDALTAKTSSTIRGSSPFILFNGINDNLLTIKIGNDVYLSDPAGNMMKLNENGNWDRVQAIYFNNPGDTFKSVQTIVTPDTVNYTLGTNLAQDIDGDGDFTISGAINANWQDKNGLQLQASDLNELPSKCFAPYKLTITIDSNDGVQLKTAFGIPNQKTYVKDSAVYYIYPHDTQPYACYARPGSMENSTGIFAGPINMWDTSKGFITQSGLSRNYNQNFPTLAGNGVYFDLLITNGMDNLNWPTVKVGDITATVSNITKDSVRVTLNGPAPTSSEHGATARKPSVLPANFKIQGNLNGVKVVEYGFELQKWFVVRDKDKLETSAGQANWCFALDGQPGRQETITAQEYRLPDPVDFTTASGSFMFEGVTRYISGLNNPNIQTTTDGGRYWRHINGGVFSEWGNLTNYGLNVNLDNYYWTGRRLQQKTIDDWDYLVVRPRDGNISAQLGQTIIYSTFCFTPDWMDW